MKGIAYKMNISKEMYIKIKSRIRKLADSYKNKLENKIEKRVDEMKDDDNSHYLIYKVLGISNEEGELIDIYQNKGRFLYRYAGSFLEDATSICMEATHKNAQKKVRIKNVLGSRPKTFEIDCLVDSIAHEIKWRDATTDGDHITKEHTRVQVIKKYGYVPVRVMFYYPNRKQSIRIQQTLETIYKGINGHYYYGDKAWEYIKDFTGIDLLCILEEIADERNKEINENNQKLAKKLVEENENRKMND